MLSPLPPIYTHKIVILVEVQLKYGGEGGWKNYIKVIPENTEIKLFPAS